MNRRLLFLLNHSPILSGWQLCPPQCPLSENDQRTLSFPRQPICFHPLNTIEPGQARRMRFYKETVAYGTDRMMIQASLDVESPEAIPQRSSALFVYNLAAIFIEASSWKRSLAAYGICTCEILVLLLQALHSNEFFFSLLSICQHKQS